MGTRSLRGAAKVSVELNLIHLHDTVHTLCSWGWWVFPLAEGKKTPVTEHGHKDATTDLSVALRLFNYGQLNNGISTGTSRLVVLDVYEIAQHVFPSLTGRAASDTGCERFKCLKVAKSTFLLEYGSNYRR